MYFKLYDIPMYLLKCKGIFYIRFVYEPKLISIWAVLKLHFNRVYVIDKKKILLMNNKNNYNKEGDGKNCVQIPQDVGYDTIANKLLCYIIKLNIFPPSILCIGERLFRLL